MPPCPALAGSSEVSSPCLRSPATWRPGTFEFRSPEVPIVAENGAKALLLNLSMKCPGVSGHHSQSVNVINRQGPERLTNTTTGALPSGRFLYSALPKDGRVVLDFNKAVNPP